MKLPQPCALVCAALIFGSAFGTTTCAQQKSLVIGIDGLGFGQQGFSVANTPWMDRLINGTWLPGYQGAYSEMAFAGGVIGTETEQPTVSGPGWSTMITSVWANRHMVVDNGSSFANGDYVDNPPYLGTLKAAIPSLTTASFVHWQPIDTYIIGAVDADGTSVNDLNFRGVYGSDDSVANAVANSVSGALDPDVLFVDFDEVDIAGHTCGSSGSCYRAQIEHTDMLVGQILSAISARPSFGNEDWQIVITADHGHLAGGGHGGQSAVERTIPFLVTSKTLRQGTLPALYQPVSQADLPPTVLDHFDVALPAHYWGVSQANGAVTISPDLNGDGIVSGDGTGPFNSDDVTAFVSFWLQPNTVDHPNPADFNLDGIANLQDWAILNAQLPSLGQAVQNALANIPEPGGGAWLILGSFVVASSCRRLASPKVAMIHSSVLCLLVLACGASADAAVLLDEDFEGLSLTSYVSPTETPTGLDWTPELPAGWTMTFNQTVGTPGDPIEFQGWRVHNVDSWITTEQNQDRALWTRGGVGSGGSVALVDPDAYDDGTNIDNEGFNSYLVAPPINLTGIPAGSVSIEFDSFWKNEVTQDGFVDVSFDGGATFTNLLTYDSATLAANQIIDAREELDVPNPASGTMIFRFGMLRGSNDWWWAIDDVLVKSEPNFALTVNRATGQMTLQGDPTDPLMIQGYSITSAVGALNSNVWSSVSATGDANSGGSFDNTHNWVRFTASGARGDLSEGVLGNTTIPGGRQQNFGNTWIRHPSEDLVFEYIDGSGNVVEGQITYAGNKGRSYRFADLNFDDAVDEGDWLEFLDGLGGEFPELSMAESYALGDLNGDLETNHADFVLFETSFDAVNGIGAFRTMLQNLPEPSGVVSVVGGLLALILSRRRMHAISLGLVPMFWIASTAPAQVLLQQDFESLTLGPYVSPTETPSGADWTDQLPPGWVMTFNQTVGTPGDPIEFQGWRVHNVDSWILTEGDQGRSVWTRGGVGSGGKVLVADPDAYGDGTNIGTAGYNSYITTPPINLSGVAANSVRLSFDSFWKSEPTEIGLVDVSFDGGTTYQNVLTYDGNTLPLDSIIDQRVSIDLTNPSNGNLVVRYAMTEASNDWWFAIDDVVIESTGVNNFLTLEVNTSSGATKIVNPSESTYDVNYYEIRSAGHSLSPSAWDSLDDQHYDAIGGGIGQSWDEGELVDDTELVEAFLLGSSTFVPEESVSLGLTYNAVVDARDLQFYIGTPGSTSLTRVVVAYVEGISGDFDQDGDYACSDVDQLVAAIAAGTNNPAFDVTGDGLVNGSDLSAWLAEAGAAELASGNPYLPGDANLSGAVDGSDFGIWNANKFTSIAAWCRGDLNASGAVDGSDFGIWNANKFTSSDEGMVPEPAPPQAFLGLLTALMMVRPPRRTTRAE